MLENRVALVTGSSRGIGRAIAQRLAADGALVIVHYGSAADRANAVVREIEAAGGQAFAVGADMTSVAAISDMFARIDAELVSRRGKTGLDILVNSAAIVVGGPLETIDEATYGQLFDTNVKGAFFVAQGAAARMESGGRIVFLSSLTAIRAQATRPLYSASKAAINGLAVSLAQYLGPRGITVNTVMPGTTRTEMSERAFAKPGVEDRVRATVAMGRIGEPSEIAGLVAALVSADGSWVTGQCIAASGGQQL